MELEEFVIFYKQLVPRPDNQEGGPELYMPYKIGDNLENENVKKIVFQPESASIIVFNHDDSWMSFSLEDIMAYSAKRKEDNATDQLTS